MIRNEVSERVKNNGETKFSASEFTKSVSSSKGLTWKTLKQKSKAQKRKWNEDKFLKKYNKMKAKELKEKSLSMEEQKCYSECSISIAVPGTILDICQTPELKSYVIGQIARAAVIFKVNEIIVYNEKNLVNVGDEEEILKLSKESRGSAMMIKILQYLECPQYLRKFFFPIHKDLHYTGLINPLDSPHHLKADEESNFREGVILDKPVKAGKGSYVYVGLKKSALIDKELKPGTRVTVQFDPDNRNGKHHKGKAVSPMTPLKLENCYWGYRVRFAPGLSSVFSKCPFKGGYDVTIGTSDKGQNYKEVTFPKYRHLLIVFGGVKGIESCIEGDESISATEPKELFNYYLNTCPSQGSRTIRTEEAVLISLTSLSSVLSVSEST